MRATDLGFRSPKERTAEYRIPVVTFDGRLLPMLQTTKGQLFHDLDDFRSTIPKLEKQGKELGQGLII